MYFIDLFWILLRPESQLIEHKESWCDEDLIDENGLDVTKTFFSKNGEGIYFIRKNLLQKMYIYDKLLCGHNQKKYENKRSNH